MFKVALLSITLACATAAGPRVSSKNGNLILEVQGGKTVGYRVVGGDVIKFEDIAPALRDYTDASLDVLSMGISVGAAQADALNKQLAAAKADIVAAQEECAATDEAPSGLSGFAAALADTAWFAVQQANKHPLQESGSVDPHVAGGAKLYIRGHGFDALYNGMAGVTGLFECGFSVDSSKSGGTLTMDTAVSAPVIECLLPDAVKTHLSSSFSAVTVTLSFVGKPITVIKFAGAVESFKAAKATVVHISPEGNFERRRHVPTAVGFAFKDAANWKCRWRLSGTGTTYDEKATWESSTRVVCSNTPRQLAQLFIADPSQTNVEVEVSLRQGNDGISEYSKPFYLHGGMCVDGLKNGLEIGEDCGTAACGYICEPGTAKVKENGKCDKNADCQNTKNSCLSGVCRPPNQYNDVVATGQTFSIKNLDNAALLTGKFTAVFKFKDGSKWSPPSVVARNGVAQFKLPKGGDEMAVTKFTSQVQFTKNTITRTNRAEGGVVQTSIELRKAGNSCPDNFDGDVIVTVSNEDGASIGSGTWADKTIAVCWYNPAYEQITPVEFYHGDNNAKYGATNNKNIYSYNCDFCDPARRKYAYECSGGYELAEAGMKTHCKHDVHTDDDAVFKQVHEKSKFIFYQWADNCGDPNEATIAAFCRHKSATGTLKENTGAVLKDYMKDVSWSN